ncbi:MFS metabolite transporter [Marinobacterium nitratireducens]|uniref:MFS metabolite transporter n=1 Tax=Marinobacterium nitratireducens TaxID=518897 RepID=A0A917Z5J4_9GAMM|nr:MFS transporter [Marinobacterium nitratireducens]GGO75912.1 MFS metabolite transporter [Marinobacterium nitratireducens]
MPDKIPYIRLSGFYLFYFALLGAIVPFWPLYLKSFEFDARTIGVLMAIFQASRIVAPNLWGWIADRTGRRIEIVRFGSGMTALVFLGIFQADSAIGIGWVMLGFSFFWNAVLPQFEVITLRQLGTRHTRYSQVRVWGSVGFIAVVLGLGWLLDITGIDALPWVMLLLMLLIWFNSCLVGQPPARADAPQGGDGFLATLVRPQVLAFYAVCFLVQFGHGPYYTFYSLLMESLGYSRGEIGLLWSLGVVAEVVIFLYMHRLVARFGLRRLMLASLWLCVLRWSLIAWLPGVVPLMLLAQVLHAATFGVLHATGIALVQQYFDDRSHGRGQALFSSLGFGAGGACGALVSGLLWESGGAGGTFTVAAMASAVAIMLTTLWIYPEKAQQKAR